jgi:hypothetical protein
MYRKKPESNEETLNELWYTVIGTNGEGLADRLKRMETKLDDYFQRGGKEASCYFLKNKSIEERNNLKRRTTWAAIAKFGVSEGIKIGTAIGAFSAIGKLIGWL